MEGSDFNSLPENCISDILSFTTPGDACRSSAVSHEFKSVINSDILWERFLPLDYEKIISESVSPIDYEIIPTKKDLYFSLCNGILTGGGCQVSRGSSTPRCLLVGNLGVNQLPIVSEKTNVGHLIIQFGENAQKLDAQPAELMVAIKNEISIGKGYLRPRDNEEEVTNDYRVAHVRADGWFEIELGDFYVNAEDDGDVILKFLTWSDYDWKRGLIV
ncbi:F-box protein PP2-B15-like [Macadamia integrifolia]|uniref:F-box protein PP2-B15-like n=1 Tax=Macadamia integrifolia TaxID=60698 RepID=UPI001C4E3469|nr:F-box protein PP2-B15-like [Macadamia integrifolia]